MQELNKIVRQKNDNGKDKDIGKTLASDRFPNTMDSFWFSVNPDIIISPFDFVTVRHIFNTRTIGMVKELKAAEDIGTAARVAVMANTGIESDSSKTIAIQMPVGEAKHVRFATQKEVIFALGIPEMQNPIPAGVIEMTNGLQVPVSLDISYLLGPDTAHVNAAGISGNLKTSYLFFLLQSSYQRLVKDMQEDVAIIIFNTKEEDLLHIDEKKKKANKKTKMLFDLLDLDIKPFDNVSYFLPRGRDGRPNSSVVPSNSKTYSFGLEDVYDRLDLLFGINDDSYNVSSILNYIYEAWPLRSGSKRVSTWSDLLEFRGYPQEVVAHKSTLLRFLGHVQRFRKSPMFIDKKVTSGYLGKEIKKIRSGDVFVIDISMIPTLQEQGFVVGDVMKSIDELYSSRQSGKRPKYILIFIDEINRFIPRPAHNISAVAEQVMRTIVAGRSRGTILFSAQQFKSTVDPALHENTGMHIIAKLGMSELSMPPYLMIDESTKANIVRLNKGELVMVHPAFRQPIKIVFPKAPFKIG
jgi:DNA helicase HerA-like ATPase